MTQEQPPLIEMRLGRIIIRDGSDLQYVYLVEREGARSFPIVIGTSEALEIERVVKRHESPRPLTHQLAHSIVTDLGGRVVSSDIVALRDETYYAQLNLEIEGAPTIAIDARPSDAIALALRARAPLRVAEHILEEAGGSTSE